MRGRRWPALAVVATVVGLLVVAVGATLGSGPAIPPPSIADAAFAARAGALCDDVLPSIRSDRPDTGPENNLDAEEVAPRIERAADGLDGLVARLDALAVAPADQAEVDRWLADWRAYVAVGRRYAATLAAGDTSTTAETGAETGRIGNRIFGFAQANGIATCRP